jgi:hypothetical protein
MILKCTSLTIVEAVLMDYWCCIADCSKVCMCHCFDHSNTQYVENMPWWNIVNASQSTAAYLIMIINMQPDTRKQWFDLANEPRGDKTQVLIDTRPGWACKGSVGLGFEWIWNRTNLIVWINSRTAPCYRDSLRTLTVTSFRCMTMLNYMVVGNIWILVLDVGTAVWVGRKISAWFSDSSTITLHASLLGQMTVSFKQMNLQPLGIEVWAQTG